MSNGAEQVGALQGLLGRMPAEVVVAWRSGALPVPGPRGLETPEQLAARRALQEEKRRRLFEDQVPLVYADARLAELAPQQDPERKVTRFLDSEKTALVLVGPPRRGKTHALYALGWEARRRGQSVYAISAPMLKRALAWERHESSDDVRRRQQTFALACESDLLLLDDLLREPIDTTGVWPSAVHEIVDCRFSAGRRIAVSANAEADPRGQRLAENAASTALMARYGAPAVLRMMHTGWAGWVDGEPMMPSSGWNPFAEGRA